MLPEGTVRALISVWDKQGLDSFAAGLHQLGVTLVSTGATACYLAEHGLPVQQVADVTGFPEILGGRVKTLHPAIHGGILARRDLPEHLAELDRHSIAPFDIVVVNLYPFAATIAQPGVTLPEAIEQIDIGGVALIRAAAKNHADVLVATEPADYAALLATLQTDGADAAMRRSLAAKAFAHTARYDAAIAGYLADDALPATLPLAFSKAQDLRYGENPHQRGALYGSFGDYFAQLHGKDLSYTNILDIAAAQELIEEFAAADGAALAIIKHTNPCGVGVAVTLAEAWEKAFATDREAPFGGVIAVNCALDLALAQRIDAIFSEIIIAPAFDAAAFELLQKKKNRRLIRALLPVTVRGELAIRSVPGGILAMESDRAPLASEPWRVVTQRAPSAEETAALRFAERVCKHVKSNAIVYTATDRTLAIGAGQMSRVDSSRIAAWRAQSSGLDLRGAVIASDALFPFPDGVETAAAAGATAVIQPGGSIRDDDVIAAADRLGLAMVFTGTRHFRH